MFKLAKMDTEHSEVQKHLKAIIDVRKEERFKQITFESSEAWRGIAVGLYQSVVKARVAGRESPASSLKSPRRLLHCVVTEQKDDLAKEEVKADGEKDIGKYEAQLETLKVEIKELKRFEIYRIAKEFSTQNYAQRFNVTYKKVITALLGEEAVYYDKF